MNYILGILAVAAFIAFGAVIAVFVPSWDLVAVLAVTGLMAAWDFWLMLRRRNGGAGPAR